MIRHETSWYHSILDQRNRTGIIASNRYVTDNQPNSQSHCLDFLKVSDSLGRGIEVPGRAAEGDEVVGLADDVPEPLAEEDVPDGELDVDEDWSGGAAMKISFWAPLANPYREL